MPRRSTPGGCPRVVSWFFSSWLKVLMKYMLSVYTCGHGKPRAKESTQPGPGQDDPS